MVYLQDSKITVENPQQVAKVLQGLLMLEDEVDRAKEHFYCLHLDIRSRINLVELISLGTLGASLASPRETFRRAVMLGSASITVAHNHPSGEADPSEEDTRTTKRLFEAGELLGIALLDHVIFTPRSFFSFKENRTGGLDSDKPLRNLQVKGGEQ